MIIITQDWIDISIDTIELENGEVILVDILREPHKYYNHQHDESGYSIVVKYINGENIKKKWWRRNFIPEKNKKYAIKMEPIKEEILKYLNWEYGCIFPSLVGKRMELRKINNKIFVDYLVNPNAPKGVS